MRLDCGCEENARTMGTMVRPGREGHGHYTHDGCYMGPCANKDDIHSPSFDEMGSLGEYCSYCGEPWPCRAVQLV